MAVFQHAVQQRDHVVLVWTGDPGEVVPNDGGVRHPHETRVLTGRIELVYRDDGSSVIVAAGESIEIEVGRAYDVEVLQGPASVHCFYPRAVPGAVEEIDHLLREKPTRFPTRPRLSAEPMR